MDLKLKNRFALVTGSTKGIGFATAKLLLMEGARVAVNGRTMKTVQSATEALRSFGEVVAAPGDLSTAHGAQSVFSAVDASGELDILINNAALAFSKEFADTNDDEWMHYLNSNLMSAVRTSRHYLPRMLKKNYGRIICLSSGSGIVPWADQVCYSVAKAAVISLSRGLAENTKGTKVTCNCIIPGPVWSEHMAEQEQRQADSMGLDLQTYLQKHSRLTAITIAKRFITVNEMANTIVYHASELSSAINGAAIRVEGGRICHI